MASQQTINLNTWSAKRVIADSNTATYSNALLQTGTAITTDVWILHRTNRNSLYGIKYLYDNSTNGTADKIEFYGGQYDNNSNDIPSAWIQLDTGNIYTIGSISGSNLSLTGPGTTEQGYDSNNTNPYIEFKNSDNTKNIRISLMTTANDKNGITINQQNNTWSFLSVQGYIYLFSPSIDLTNVNNNNGISSGTLSMQVQALDVNGADFGLLQFSAKSDGATYNVLCSRNIVNSVKKYIGIYSSLNKNGTGNIYLRNTAATSQDIIFCEFGSSGNTVTISGKTVIEDNNQWVTPARIQLNRYDGTAYTDRACVGVTNGNLHLDAYNTNGIYLNHYSNGGNVYFNGSTYYINGGNYNGNAATATKLQTARSLWGQSFNGTADISGAITSSGTIKSTYAGPAFLAQTATSSWSYLRLHNGSNYWDIATKSDDWSGALEFRPGGAASKGPYISTAGMTSFADTANDASYANAAIQIREQGYAGAGSDTWGRAPRLAWHWSGRVAAQIGLASNGYLYTAPSTGTSFYKLVYESGSWGISVTGSSGSCTGHAASDLALSGGTMTGQIKTSFKTSVAMGSYGSGQTTVAGLLGEVCYSSGAMGSANITTAWSGSSGTIPTGWYNFIYSPHRSGGANGAASGDNHLYGTLILCGMTVGSQMWRIRMAGTVGSITEARRIWNWGDAVTSAVWNDYAEYRTAKKNKPGQVLYELGDDTLAPTIERLQHFAGVASDTWGFAQGETTTAKTPIAVSGRVLVYTYQPRENYKPGDCVCAAPGGTVDIMTREEVIQYPDRIVGTVSCVPEYDEWGGGKYADRDPVKVNGRIWIKVH